MSFTDPIADMFVRVRNAQRQGAGSVEMGHSRVKGEIARIMKREGYIADYVVEGGVKKTLRVYLKYGVGHEAAIKGIRRLSKSGLRRCVKADAIPKVLGGMGLCILSTSAGMMTDREARSRKIGGELVCSMW